MRDDEGAPLCNDEAQERQDRFDDDSMWKDLIERFFYPLLERAIAFAVSRVVWMCPSS